MAVFEQRRELNRQRRQQAAEWDDSFGLKLLGYNKYGKTSGLGHIMGAIPGLNTARHAVAKSFAGKDTKQVLDDTFDEAIGRDLAGAALGINIAKSVAGGGLSSFGQGMLKDGLFKKGMLKDGLFKKGGGDMAGEVMNQGMEEGGEFMEFAKNAVNQVGGQDNAKMKEMLNSISNNNMVNPYEVGTPEYESFEAEKNKRNTDLGQRLKKGVGNLFQSATGGNLVESAVQYGAQTIDSYRAQNEAFNEYAKGTLVDPGAFNYL
jgi:hypothetical protein